MQRQFIIDEQLLQALANYLGTRPIQECLGLFNALQNLKPHIENPEQNILATEPDGSN